MRVLIIADIEGISGVYTVDQTSPKLTRFNEGRDCMTADINACAAGLKAAGVDFVAARDCHGNSFSVRWENISDDVDELVCGEIYSDRFDQLETFDAVVLLGYHAMAGTHKAVLEHSMSSREIQNYWINGEKAGEVAIDAGIAGDKGVPVIMVSGDDKVCKEAKELLPWIETAQVKRGLSSFGAAMLPPQRAHKLIFDTAKKAVENIKNAKPLVFDKPIRFRVDLMDRVPLPNLHNHPDVKIIDGRSYELEAETVEKALFRSL